MSKQIQIKVLRRRIQRLSGQIKKVEHDIETGDLRTHVRLVGEQKFLRERKAQLEVRLNRLKAQPEGSWNDFKAQLNYLADEFALAMQNLLARH